MPELPNTLDLRVLDDTERFLPDERFRAAAKKRGRVLRSHRRARFAAASSLVVVAVLAGSFVGLARLKSNQVTRVTMAGIPQVDEHGAPATLNQTNLREPFNVLVVGTDDQLGPDRDNAARGDSIMIVHVDMAARTIRMVSVPRDLWVTIADGSPNPSVERMNTAIEKGPATLIRTVNQTFGVRIDHFVQLNGPGLERMVDAIGGVPLSFDASVRDSNTGLDVSAGCHVLDGEQALQLARSRHLEVRGADGTYREDPTSDLGRQRRQQVLGEAIVRQAGRHALSVGGFTHLAGVATENLVLDDHLGVTDLIELANWSRDLPSDAVTSMLPSVSPRITPQGGAVLDLGPTAPADVRSFLDDRPPSADGTSPAVGGTPAPVPPVPLGVAAAC